MGATTKIRPQSRRSVHSIDLPMKAATKILGGTQTCTDANGLAVPATNTGGLTAWGPAQGTADNTDGGTAAIKVNVRLAEAIEVTLWDNDTGTPLTRADVGHQAHMLDNQTLTGDATVGSPGPIVYEVTTEGVWAYCASARGEDAANIPIDDVAGIYTATDVEGALAEVKVLADAGMPVLKKTVTVGQADLTAAVNGLAQAINIGTALPSNARIVGVDMRSYTPFTGGGASAVALDVGTSGDVDALVDGADALAAAVDGGPATMPPGVRPNKTFASGGQLIATFTPDGGATLLALTAGSIVIDVLYTVLA
jgi:hypothetical protein